MLIKPNLKDEEIIACLRDAYELDVKSISFLPLGADFNTAVYRVITTVLNSEKLGKFEIIAIINSTDQKKIDSIREVYYQY